MTATRMTLGALLFGVAWYSMPLALYVFVQDDPHAAVPRWPTAVDGVAAAVLLLRLGTVIPACLLGVLVGYPAGGRFRRGLAGTLAGVGIGAVLAALSAAGSTHPATPLVVGACVYGLTFGFVGCLAGVGYGSGNLQHTASLNAHDQPAT